MPSANVVVTVLARKKLFARALAGVGVASLCSLLVILMWQGVSKSSIAPCPFRVPSQELSTGRSFNSYVDRGDCIRLARATTQEDLQQGLSGRGSMPFDEGLLFVFSGSGSQCMWMKDMRFNLDMIWLDDTKTIRGIESNLSPQSYPTSYCKGPASYVIEVNSGVVKAAKLKIGDKLQF